MPVGTSCSKRKIAAALCTQHVGSVAESLRTSPGARAPGVAFATLWPGWVAVRWLRTPPLRNAEGGGALSWLEAYAFLPFAARAWTAGLCSFWGQRSPALGPESSQQEPRFLCKAEPPSPPSCVGAQGGLVSHSLPPVAEGLVHLLLGRWPLGLFCH